MAIDDGSCGQGTKGSQHGGFGSTGLLSVTLLSGAASRVWRRRGTAVEQARDGLLEAISHKAREELLYHPRPQIGGLPPPALTIWMQIALIFIILHICADSDNSSSQWTYLPMITIYVLVVLHT